MPTANDDTKTAAYENYPANGLTRGNSPSGGTTITAGTFAQNIAEVGEALRLDVEVTMLGTTTPTDLSVEVYPVDQFGNAVGGGSAPFKLTQVQGAGPAASGGNLAYWATFDVSGQDRVSIRIDNNSAGPKTVNWSWKAQ
jgi:hypothetical protein